MKIFYVGTWKSTRLGTRMQLLFQERERRQKALAKLNILRQGNRPFGYGQRAFLKIPPARRCIQLKAFIWKELSDAIDAETIRPQMNIFQAHERAPTPLSNEPDSPTANCRMHHATPLHA
jgi:hypothetical protein